MIPVIVEVAISLIVVFYLMSTLVSFINEIIALAISSRGKTLKSALHELLEQGKKETDGIVERIYQSPHIHKLRIFSFLTSKNYLPATIQPSGFSNALIEVIHKGANFDFHVIEASIDNLPNPFLKKHLKKLIAELDGQQRNVLGLKLKIEQWFNSYMETVTRVYKLRTRVIVAIISISVCALLQIDTIALMKYFWENKEKREMMVKFADGLQESHFRIDTVKTIQVKDSLGKEVPKKVALTEKEKSEALIAAQKKVLAELYNFDLPIGYNKETLKDMDARKLALMILGMLITSFCLTLGAPFWYEMMKKLVDARKQLAGSSKASK